MTNEEKIKKELREKGGKLLTDYDLLKIDGNDRGDMIIIGEEKESDPNNEIRNHQPSEIPPINNMTFNARLEFQNSTARYGKFGANMRWIRRLSWLKYLLPYFIAFLLIMSYIKIGDHFGERKPKALFQKIFYTQQYWQEKVDSIERQKQFLEASLFINDIDLTNIKSSRKLIIEKEILSAKALGMDTYQARRDAEEEINNQIRKIGLMNQFSQKELETITNQLESAKRELTHYK